MKMRKKILGILALMFLATIVLTGCGGNNDQASNDKTIKIAASPTPHAEILEHVAPFLEKKGYKLDIKKFDDFIMPNKALANGEVDANYFQHVPFYKKAVQENNYKFAIAGAVHIEPMGLYSEEIKNIKNVKAGGKIVASESVTDWGRIIGILQKAKLVEIKPGTQLETATFEDISKNPKNLKFIHNIKPEMLVQAYKNKEGELVAINATFAFGAGLDPTKDALMLESDNSPYDNIVAVQKGAEKSAKIKALMKVLHKREVQNWILKKWDGSVKPVADNAWKQ